MQRLCRTFVNPFQGYNLVHVYHRLVLYSTSTSTSVSTDSLANYLVNLLRFSPQQGLSASKRLSLRLKVNDFEFDANNAISVVVFFKSHGFDDIHLRRIVSWYPELLCYNVDDTLRHKLQYLRDQGFSEFDIIQVVYRNPRLLALRVDTSIVPAFEVLRKVMGSDTHVIAILKKSWSDISSTKNLVPNVALLTIHGIPIELIRKHFLKSPAAYTRKHEIFKDMVTRVKNNWGICPNSPVFLYGIHLSQLGEVNIESKCRMFKSFGWTQSDIQTLMMKCPNCFGCSEAAINKKLNFLMNELRLEPAYLISHLALLTCSLEKRIVPRHKILLFLKEKGLLKKNPSFSTAFQMTESRFLNMFVLPFKEVHKVYAELTGCSMKMLPLESSKTLGP